MILKHFHKLFLGLVFSLGMPLMCQADILNFDETAFGGFQGATSLSLSNADIFSLGDDLFVYQSGDFGIPDSGFCATEFGSCEADAEIVFSNQIADLTFYSLGFNSGDFAVATIYNGVTPLASATIDADMTVDFSGFSDITRLVIDDSSTGAGMSYHAFTFNAVPEPGTFSILTLGLIGLAHRRRRG